jgi:hypothetical protein
MVGALGACTQLEPGSDRLEGDLAASSAAPLDSVGAVAPEWACLADPAPGSATSAASSLEFDFWIINFVTESPLPETSARACQRIDVGCALPVAGPVEAAADGRLHLTLPSGFSGFLEITAAGISPVLYFFGQPLRASRQDVLMVLDLATADALSAASNVDVDPELGVIVVRTMDCQGARSAGVRFANDAGGLPFAFVDGLPVAGQDVSHGEGVGGFLNVPPGIAALQAWEVSSGRSFGDSSVVVRAGWASHTDLSPMSQ